MSLEKHKREYKESLTKEQDLNGLYNLVKFILDSDDINLKLKSQIIDNIIWKITEIDDKLNIRYRSKLALTTDEKVQHEHVVTKKFLINRLFKYPELYKTILDLAVACIVTESEHDQLSKIKNLEGWERYNNIGITVIDMLTKKEININELILPQKPIIERLKN